MKEFIQPEIEVECYLPQDIICTSRPDVDQGGSED